MGIRGLACSAKIPLLQHGRNGRVLPKDLYGAPQQWLGMAMRKQRPSTQGQRAKSFLFGVSRLWNWNTSKEKQQMGKRRGAHGLQSGKLRLQREREKTLASELGKQPQEWACAAAAHAIHGEPPKGLCQPSRPEPGRALLGSAHTDRRRQSTGASGSCTRPKWEPISFARV